MRIDGYVNCVGARSRRPINLIKPSHTAKILNINVTSFIEMVRIITKKNMKKYSRDYKTTGRKNMLFTPGNYFSEKPV